LDDRSLVGGERTLATIALWTESERTEDERTEALNDG